MSTLCVKSVTVATCVLLSSLLLSGCSGTTDDPGTSGELNGAGGSTGDAATDGESGGNDGTAGGGDTAGGSGGGSGSSSASGGASGSASGDSGSASGDSGSASGGSGGTTTSGGTPIASATFHVFGHSAFTYDGGDEAPATPYTRTGTWLGLLAGASGTESVGSFSFGQYAVWNSYNWSDPNDVTITGVYDVGNTSQFSGDFGGQSFTHFISMPSNFLDTDHGAPPYNSTVANTQAGWRELDDNIDRYYPAAEHLIYVYFPDGGFYPVAASNSRDDFAAFNNDVMGNYLDWYIRLQDAVAGTGREVRTIPAGPVISWLLENESYLSDLAFNDLFGDSAPHGSENIYLLAAMVTYRTLFSSAPNLDSFAIPSDANQILPAIEDNLAAIDAAIASRLNHHQANGVQVW